MKKLIVVGHSLINYRQYSLFEEMAEQYPESDILILPPDRWRDETIKPIKKINFEIKCLKYLGTNYNFTRFWIENLEKEIKKFNPDILYVEEEVYSLFTYTLIKILKADNPKTRIILFTWENKFSMYEYLRDYGGDKIWKYCLENSDLIVCGNELAEEVSKKIYSEVKTTICPQTGIDIKLFHKIKEEEKIYDLVFHGRMVEEKGVEFIEKLAKELNLKMLWIGGRGDFKPSYGDYVGWVKDEDLPKYLNKAKIGIQLPYNYKGYSEQFNFCIGQNLACGNPVICTDNGSIPDVYQGSPAIILPQEDISKGDLSKIKPILQTLLEDEKERKRLGREGRKWVLDNISNRRVAEKLYNILRSSSE